MSSIEILTESGYPRLMQILSGLVPSIHTFGIVTAENPNTKHLTNKENKERNNKLKKRLRNFNYGFIQIIGKYGNIENPFFILNIKKKDLLEMGRDYGQESVIFGVVSQYGKLRFEFVLTYPPEQYGKVDSIRNIWRIPDEEEIKEKDAVYSEYKGRKFIIPFFDNNFNVHEIQESLFLGKVNSNLVNVNQLSYDKEYLEQFDDSEINELMNRIIVVNESLHKNGEGGFCTWANRGSVLVNTNKISTILEEKYKICLH